MVLIFLHCYLGWGVNLTHMGLSWPGAFGLNIWHLTTRPHPFPHKKKYLPHILLIVLWYFHSVIWGGVHLTMVFIKAVRQAAYPWDLSIKSLAPWVLGHAPLTRGNRWKGHYVHLTGLVFLVHTGSYRLSFSCWFMTQAQSVQAKNQREKKEDP